MDDDSMTLQKQDVGIILENYYIMKDPKKNKKCIVKLTHQLFDRLGRVKNPLRKIKFKLKKPFPIYDRSQKTNINNCLINDEYLNQKEKNMFDYNQI